MAHREHLDVDALQWLVEQIVCNNIDHGYQNSLHRRIWDFKHLHGPAIELSEQDKATYSLFTLGLSVADIGAVLKARWSKTTKRDIITALSKNLACRRPLVLARLASPGELGFTPSILKDVVGALNMHALKVRTTQERKGYMNLIDYSGLQLCGAALPYYPKAHYHDMHLLAFGWARGAVGINNQGERCGSAWSSWADCCSRAHEVQPAQFPLPREVATWSQVTLSNKVQEVLWACGVAEVHHDANQQQRAVRARVLHAQQLIRAYIDKR
ncbi:hypothetical protein GPECTOR_6g687 [Gonium pectorale]|uniref:Uncharacterized protein n=1 Tax=Gonium pectorale TaxID=33097 RepID=A0A150GV96_GONPE|nr:hypothetical protein GPECTOR_6g687 [Gonium pectorale]|eukprot:KXZ53769.1 hypothetical protein GPECTOR_6g687 [Gonium pectorale]